MKKKLIFIVILIIIAAAAGIWYLENQKNKELESESLLNEVQYLCKDGKSIKADYFEGEIIEVQPDEMPIPTGEVKVVLSDGRELILPQTISASGVRYANEDDSIIFWSKGNGAFLLEDDVQTYSGCIIVSEDPGGLSSIYLDNEGEFLLRYPAGYRVDTEYKYSALGPGKEIEGTKFIIPESISEGTNLSSFDTGISIEMIPIVENCNAGLFLQENIEIEEKVEDETIYSFATSVEGGAGNRYEEQVWVMPTIHNCVAVRYFIHSTNIENYPEGEVSEFNKDTLLSQFDKIRRSLVLQ